MSPTNHTKNSCNYRALLLLATYSTATALLLALPSDSDAGDLVISPSMTTELIFTDNVRLAPKGEEEADFVTRLIPGVYGKYTSRRFNGEVDYRLINIIYQQNTENNRTLHNLNARGTGELVKDFFFVDGGARMVQLNRSLLGRQGDDVNLTGNLSNIRQYSVSPYIVRRFGGIATAQLRYARIMTDSDSSRTFFNSQANSYTGSVLSGSDFQILQWGLNYTRQDIDFDLRPDSVRLESGLANVRYNLTRRFGLTGAGGYENNNFGGGSLNTPKGARWQAGFIWLPTPRTSIEAWGGQRFFGDTYFADASHRTRLFAMNARYKEDITSAWNILNIDNTGNTVTVLTDLFTAQAPPGTDPAEIAQLVQLLLTQLGLPSELAFASSYLTNRFFLEKNFESSIGASAAKNTAVIRVFHTTRTPIDNSPLLDSVVGGGTLQANVRQEGVSGLWSYAVSPRTRINADFNYRRLYFRTIGRRDQIYMSSLSVSRDLSENIFGLLRWRRVNRTSDSNDQGYTENRFSVLVSLRF